MKRLAIFVEGQTEQLFVERLVKEIAGRNKVNVILQHASGGKKVARSFTTIKGTKSNPTSEYMILIVDSATDNRVVSDMIEQYPTLQREGYSKIIGIRDLYPEKLESLSRLEGLNNLVLNNSIPTDMHRLIIAIMEVETWFVSEYSHYSKLNNGLNVSVINEKFGIDIMNDDLELSSKYSHPADLLNKIYNTIGEKYDKKKETVNKVVQLLDYEELYVNSSKRLSKFNELVVELDNFF